LLQQLTQQRPCRYDTRFRRREAVDRFEGQVEDGLKCMGGVCLRLEMGKGWRQRRVGLLHFDQQPRLAVADNQEVDFALRLVAQVAEFKISEPQIGPALNRLQQMTADKGLGPVARVIDSAPVAQKWLGEPTVVAQGLPLWLGDWGGWLDGLAGNIYLKYRCLVRTVLRCTRIWSKAVDSRSKAGVLSRRSPSHCSVSASDQRLVRSA
jgi:hypothetical protein